MEFLRLQNINKILIVILLILTISYLIYKKTIFKQKNNTKVKKEINNLEDINSIKKNKLIENFNIPKPKYNIKPNVYLDIDINRKKVGRIKLSYMIMLYLKHVKILEN